jgi:hypothetical protein
MLNDKSDLKIGKNFFFICGSTKFGRDSRTDSAVTMVRSGAEFIQIAGRVCI